VFLAPPSSAGVARSPGQHTTELSTGCDCFNDHLFQI